MISFIRNFLPNFQSEISKLARLSKQSMIQFVKQNESLFLETNTLTGLNTLVDLDELLLTTSITNQQLKRRFSPDFLIDSENLNLTSKRFHSLNTASPPIAKLQQPINQPNGQSTVNNNLSSSKTIASSINSTIHNSNLNNPSILHNHLTQARTAMLEELMSNRYYQSPIQQQFNLINQHLNQQIAVHGGNGYKIKQQPNLLQHSINGLNTNLANGNQLAGNQLNSHLQSNLLAGGQLNKQQLERLALLERYEKEIALQSKQQQTNLNALRSNLESSINSNVHNLPRTTNNLSTMNQASNQLINGLNLTAAATKTMPPSNQLLNQLPNQQRLNEMTNDEEWKNIDTMLNCIINMVEKTKTALNILHQKNQENLVNHHQMNHESISPIDWQQRNKIPLKTLPINKNLQNISNQSLPAKSITPPIIENGYLDLSKSKDQLFSSLNFSSANPKMPLHRINAQTGIFMQIFI